MRHAHRKNIQIDGAETLITWNYQEDFTDIQAFTDSNGNIHRLKCNSFSLLINGLMNITTPSHVYSPLKGA
jgi:hypothetical protein